MENWLTRNRAYAAFGIIMLAALLLRLPGIQSPLAPDETFSYDEYVRTGLERMLLERYQCNNQPLSSLLTWGTTRLLGDADWVMRLPALFAGMSLFPVMFAFGIRAFGGRGPALLGVYFLAIHLYHIAYTVNFRSYTLVMLFATLTAWQLTCLVERPSWKYLPGIAITTFLMAYSHIVSLLLLAGWGLSLLVYLGARAERGAWRDYRVLTAFVAGGTGLTLGLALTSIAYIPAFFLPAAIVSRLLTGKWPADAFNFVSGAEQRDWLSLDRYTDVLSSMTGAPFWLAVLLGVFGCIAYFRQGKAGAGIILLTLLGPAIALIAANLKIEPRYSLSLLPFYCMALGAGVWHAGIRMPDYLAPVLPRVVFRLRGAVQVLTALLLCAGFAAAMMPRYFLDFPHSAPNIATVLWDHKAALYHVRDHGGPFDVVAPTPALEMQFGHCADKYLRRYRPAPEAPATAARVWLMSSPGEADFATSYGYPAPLQHAGSFSFCELHYADVTPEHYHPAALAPLASVLQAQPGGWTLSGLDVNGRAVADAQDAVNTVWYESAGGRNDAWFQSVDLPIETGRLVAFRVWVQRGAATDILAQLVFVDATQMPLEYRITREPRREAATPDGWELYFVETLVPKDFVACRAELRMRGRMNAGDRVGVRNPEIWIDARPGLTLPYAVK